MKIKLLIILQILLTGSVLAVVTFEFTSWRDLENRSSDIVIAKCSQTPNEPTIKDGIFEAPINIEIALKGDAKPASAILDSHFRLFQGEHYLIFSWQNDGVYQAIEDYRIIPLGPDFLTNMVIGTTLDEQISGLLRRRLNSLKREEQQQEEERSRLEKPVRISSISNAQREVTLVSNGLNAATTPPKLEAVTSPSGERAEIGPDGRRVTLTDKSGKVIWSKDIVETFGTNLPMYFAGKIGKPEISGNILVLRAGNEFIEVDSKNGEIISRNAY